MLEQAQDVLLGLDALLWHRDPHDMPVPDDDGRRVAFGWLLNREAEQHRILEVRGISRWQAIELDIVEAAFEDLWGLRHCFTSGALDM